MFKVILKKKAREFYLKADQPLAKKLARCFEILEENPRHHPNIKFLKSQLKGFYRYRVGDYRVIYEINDQEITVIVVTIAHRSQVYQ